MKKKTIGLILGPLSFVIIYFFLQPAGLEQEGLAVLAATSWIAIWWITEALQVEVTALLPIILFPITGALGLTETCAAFGHKFIFLFIGGFVLALAIEKWNLHKRIALLIIKAVGTNLSNIILGFMLSTAFMSMWISNTATTVMMLPIGAAIIKQMSSGNGTKQFGKALMLSIAYSASIGGMATLIGTPPNIVLAGILESTLGIELSFSKWFMFGFPITLVLLFICWKYLTSFAFGLKKHSLEGGKSYIKDQLDSLGKMSFEEKLVLAVFVLTAMLWIFRSAVLKSIIPAIDDTIIAIFAALLLFLLPSSKKGKKLMEWKDAVKLPWGILLLFGGGIAIAVAFDESGLALWIAENLSSLGNLHLFLLLLILIICVNFLTEITSNLATVSVLLPVLAPLAFAINVNPLLLMVACTIAASCAFMLPVATAPNAIVFSSGYLKMNDMMKAGFWMNMISILLLTIAVYFLLPLLWKIDVYSTN